MQSNKWQIEHFDPTKFYIFYMGEYVPHSSFRLFLRGKLFNGDLPALSVRHMYNLKLRPTRSASAFAQLYASNEKRKEWVEQGFSLKLNAEGVRYVRNNKKASMLLELNDVRYNSIILK